MSYFRCRRLVRNDLVACQDLHHAAQACRRTTRQPRAFTFFTWRSVCDSCISQKKLRRKIAHFPLIKWLAGPNPPGSVQLSDLSGHPSPSLDKRPTTTLASKQRFLQYPPQQPTHDACQTCHEGSSSRRGAFASFPGRDSGRSIPQKVASAFSNSAKRILVTKRRAGQVCTGRQM